MTEPVLINRSMLIAFMVVVQTLTAPLVALASLYIVAQAWHLSFEHSPSTLVVIITLQFLVLTHPPRDLSEQLIWRPLATSAGVVLRWALLLVVLVIVAHSSSAIAAYPHRAFQTWALATPAALVISTLALGQVMRRVVASAVGNRKVIFAGYNSSSLALARSLETNRAMRLSVEDSSTTGLRSPEYGSRYTPGRAAVGSGRIRQGAHRRCDIHRPARASHQTCAGPAG